MCGLTVVCFVLHHAARVVRVLLPPDVESEFHLLVAPLRGMHVFESQRLFVQDRAACPRPAIPRRRRRSTSSSSRSASPSGV